jgi:type I restriction-modification system DNA methylase subunit
MKLTQEIKDKIIKEFNDWMEVQYAGKNKKERQEFGQFFTPPELTIQLIEGFDNLKGTTIDPTCGCGGLLAACILAGADPNKCYGIELDPDILELARERLGKLGVPKYNLHLGNALNDECYDNFNDKYSYDPKTDRVKIEGQNEFSSLWKIRKPAQ